MKQKRWKKIVGAIVMSAFVTVEGWATTDLTHLSNEAHKLYVQGHYAAAEQAYARINQEAEPNSEAFLQSQYYLAACKFQLNEPDAIQALTKSVNNYAYAPMVHHAHFMLAQLYVEKKRYKQVLQHLAQCDVDKLDASERSTYIFVESYSQMQMGEMAKAKDGFAKLDGTRYEPDAHYYLAHINYLENNDETAETLFRSLTNTHYEEAANFGLLQILSRQHRTSEAVALGEQLVTRYPDSEYLSEAFRILGESAYEDKTYSLAKTYLQRYAQQVPEMSRADHYMLGVSAYFTDDFILATQHLTPVVDSRDTLAQNALLCLGHAYRLSDQATLAKTAYQNAASINLDAKATEEALYNYALCCYDTHSSFQETNNALTRFIENYPNSTHTSQIYNVLTTHFLEQENYTAAYRALQKANMQTPKMREVKEYVCLGMGVNAFKKHNYERAKLFFDQAIEAYDSKKSVSAQAFLWRGETNYKLGEMAACRNDLNTFLSAPQQKTTTTEQQACYTMAYTYFETQNYSTALSWYQRWLKKGTAADGVYVDVLCRVGDCYFNARNFTAARQNYNKAVATAPTKADYAAFQDAFIYGLQKQYGAKITAMQAFLKDYPRSAYVSAARYEIGRSYVMKEQYSEAILAYNHLIETSPKSAEARTASLEIGLLYANLNQTDAAITAYKNVVNKYPNTSEAVVAMESLEALYIDKNDVEQYVAFRNSVPQNVVSSLPQNSEDSLAFVAAERMYAKGDASAASTALERYIAKYCQGSTNANCATAYYYLADCQRRLKNNSSALENYRILITQFDETPYLENALTQAADIAYSSKAYMQAADYFNQLQLVTLDTTKQKAALLGVLRSYYNAKDYTKTIETATTILYETEIDSARIKEAAYYRAKSLLMKKNYDAALPDLRLLAVNVKELWGAESHY
ncbi:MAG: tetratricopeptide repeat protein, partial [Bacteroidales bacterium]|nr:tetratricopeptide repeat protein [Bacteroidales bacterium]